MDGVFFFQDSFLRGPKQMAESLDLRLVSKLRLSFSLRLPYDGAEFGVGRRTGESCNLTVLGQQSVLVFFLAVMMW